jgi:hypothetical protein
MGLYSRQQLERDLAAVERFDQEISAKVARGELSGFVAVTMGREVAKKINSLRMKLVNAGQLIADLRAAKREAASVDTPGCFDHADINKGRVINRQRLGFAERGAERVKKTFQKIRWNSDGIQNDSQNTQREALEAPRSHEVDLRDPTAQNEIRSAQNASKRMYWRPNGRNVVVIYDD